MDYVVWDVPLTVWWTILCDTDHSQSDMWTAFNGVELWCTRLITPTLHSAYSIIFLNAIALPFVDHSKSLSWFSSSCMPKILNDLYILRSLHIYKLPTPIFSPVRSYIQFLKMCASQFDTPFAWLHRTLHSSDLQQLRLCRLSRKHWAVHGRIVSPVWKSSCFKRLLFVLNFSKSFGRDRTVESSGRKV